MEELFITEPEPSVIKEAYRSLPKGGCLKVKVKKSALPLILKVFERTGFVAIEIHQVRQGNVPIEVTGYKGKHGACIDTGRKARYIGAALAVIDDDNHVLIRESWTPVCEKTAGIYLLSPYRPLIEVTGKMPGSDDTSQELPVLFECDGLEEDLAVLDTMITGEKNVQDEVYVFYPGPFKWLILSNGKMIRRGVFSKIARSDLKNISRKDYLQSIRAEDIMPDEIVQDLYFQDEYPQKGPIFILEDIIKVDMNGKEKSKDPEMYSLDKLNPKLQKRLRDLIENKRKFFILTGSDPSDDMGCCPSDEVGAAGKLVEAGILCSVRQEVPEGACPVTVYALAGEIQTAEGELSFRKNLELRKDVLQQLKGSKTRDIRNVLKWILLVFVLISLVYATIRIINMNTGWDKESRLYEQLRPVSENTTFILLFHNRTRCNMCLNMEGHIRALIEEKYSDYLSDGRLQFELITMNNEVNRVLVDRFELYTASVVLIRFREGEEDQVVVLRDIWDLHTEKEMFTRKLDSELMNLMED